MAGKGRQGADGSGGAVLALHSSAGSGAQWRQLAERLGAQTPVVAPDLWGYGRAPMWSGERPLALADEAARALQSLPAHARNEFDLVGHSYGGAVALHIARHHPGRVRSLVLIEPVAFHLLAAPSLAPSCVEALAEVRGLAGSVDTAVRSGEYEKGMARFVDYWNGSGAWEELAPAAREALAARVLKVPMDFAAALTETGGLEALRGVRCPVLVLRGARSPRPVRLLATLLAGALPRAELATLDNAGHMLPITHARACNELIAWHLANAGRALPGRAA